MRHDALVARGSSDDGVAAVTAAAAGGSSGGGGVGGGGAGASRAFCVVVPVVVADVTSTRDTDGATLLDLTVELTCCDEADCFWSSGVSCCITWRVADVDVLALDGTSCVTVLSGFSCGCCCCGGGGSGSGSGKCCL